MLTRFIAFMGLCGLSLFAATLPSGFTETAIPGLSSPSAMTIAPDGRIFICEQGGALRIVKDGVLLPTAFLALPVDSSGERGLLGVAVPDSQYVYLYYTVPGNPPRNRLSRFTQTGDSAAAGSEVVLMEFEGLAATNHNGGAIHFGPDGKIYVAIGENAVPSNAQSLNTRLGKILRLNPDGTIPTDNPFYNTATGNNRAIWALGLRNPYTFAFQNGTGRMLINDVGQNTFEEINDGIAGSNYGWPASEGPTTNPAFRGPLYYYGHNGAGGCAISGGAFYSPPTNQFPTSYAGQYFYADFCGGYVRYIDPNFVQFTGVATEFATGINQPVDVAVSNDGSLYYLSRGAGTLFKVTYSNNQMPSITQHPQNVTAATGGMAMFSVGAAGSQPLSFQWQRNGVNISGANAPTLTVNPVSASDNGAQYRVILTNLYGTATSNNATLSVINNQSPTAVITAPSPAALYSGGDVVTFNGSGTDAEDGAIPTSAMCWRVDFYKDNQPMAFLPQTCNLRTGTVTIPSVGETSANVFYRFTLIVRDSQNVTGTSFVDLQPRKVQLRVDTLPRGLQIIVDGQTLTAPYQADAVAGITRTVGTISPQQAVGSRYQFASWSDGGAISHSFVTPVAGISLTASFSAQYLLTTTAVPVNGGTITVTPGSPDGYYPAGANVQLRATANPTFEFAGWNGGLAGTTNPQTLLMEGPRTVTAVFSGQPSCSYQLGHLTSAYDPTGDIGRFTITAPSTCAWTVSTTAQWITILSGGTGVGYGTVAFRVDPNPIPGPRVGTITAAGQTFTVRQEPPGCTYQLSTPALTIPPLGGDFSFDVSTGAGCFWTAEASPGWIALNDALGRIGPGTLNFTVPSNTTNSARIGSISVGGQVVQVLQNSATLTPPFSDVQSSYLFAPFISLLKETNIAYPCSPNTYCPEVPVTRSQMAVLIVRAVLRTDTFSYGQIPYFSDVPASHPEFAFIQKLRELGVTNGCTATTYCPESQVTRGQMAAFIIRARYGLSSSSMFPYPATPYFSDVPAGDLFFSYIQKLRQISITVGCSATSFCPAEQNLRGQLASFLARAFLAP